MLLSISASTTIHFAWAIWSTRSRLSPEAVASVMQKCIRAEHFQSCKVVISLFEGRKELEKAEWMLARDIFSGNNAVVAFALAVVAVVADTPETSVVAPAPTRPDPSGS